MDNELRQSQLKEIQLFIEGYGNDHTWYMIENLKYLRDRLPFRALFFEVGGRVPEKELIL